MWKIRKGMTTLNEKKMEKGKLDKPRIVTTLTLAATTKRDLRMLARRNHSTMGRVIDELVEAAVKKGRPVKIQR